MKIPFTVIIFLLSVYSFASDPSPVWGGWKIDAHGVGCDLAKSYWVPEINGRNHRGFLTNTKFNRASMRFTAYTFTHGDIIKEEDIGIIRFVLQLDPITQRIEEKDKIKKATIGGIESSPRINPTYDMHQFWLNGEDSLNLIQKFENNEIVDFSLILETNETLEFRIYPSGNYNGHVWVAMFNTCIKEHVRRRHN